jgi:hypothetical protein
MNKAAWWSTNTIEAARGVLEGRLRRRLLGKWARADEYTGNVSHTRVHEVFPAPPLLPVASWVLRLLTTTRRYTLVLLTLRPGALGDGPNPILPDDLVLRAVDALGIQQGEVRMLPRGWAAQMVLRLAPAEYRCLGDAIKTRTGVRRVGSKGALFFPCGHMDITSCE